MKFLENLLRRGCTHRFAWPRVDCSGRHYQVCLRCGATYEYDWRRMRQTGRLLIPALHEGHGILPRPRA